MRYHPHYIIYAQITLGLLSFFTTRIAYTSDDLSAYTNIHSFSYSEPVAVKAQINKWNDHLDSNAQRAFTYNRLEAGIEHARGWRIGALWRYDYRLSFSPDTAEIYHASENDNPLDKGRTYNVDLEAAHFRAQGLTLGYLFRWSKLTVAPSLSLLRADALMDGSLRGIMTVDASGKYNASAKVDYFYSEDALFDRSLASSPKGWGYGVDLTLTWTPTINTEASLAVYDLFAQLHWDQAPYTQAVVITEAQSSNENGFLSFKPVLSGIESHADYTQRLPSRHILSFKRQLNDYFNINASRWDWHQTVIHTLAIGLSQGEQRLFELEYGLEPGYWTLAYRDRRVQLSLTADALPFSSAHVLGTSLKVSF